MNKSFLICALLVCAVAPSALGVRLGRVAVLQKDGGVKHPGHFQLPNLLTGQPHLGKSVNGGTNCAACTIVVGIIGSLAEVHSQNVDKVVSEVCNLLPKSPLRSICDDVILKYGKAIITGLENKETPDVICRDVKLCTSQTCNLYPPPSADVMARNAARPKPNVPDFSDYVMSQPMESPWQWLKDLINRFANNHDPLIDFDGDKFASVPTLRGYEWRGKDCNDLDKDIHPGRVKQASDDASVDHNCNGILGSNTTGSYEDIFCGSSDRRGTMVIGDSAGAHFEIPPQYFNATLINSTTFEHVLFRLEDEFDLPMKSWTTGWANSTASAPVASLYEQMRKNNLCNHRDYQNLGVNGMRSGASLKLVDSVGRNNQTDAPMTVMWELIGNDVCHPEPSVGAFTTPAEFKTNILASLTELDNYLPAGSHVILVGLADGRVLWDSLHDRLHPLGVKYPAVYDFLNCLEISPCWGWLNSNETVRNATSARAAELSQVYQEILAANTTFRNFDMVYYDFPFGAIITKWKAQGGQAWELIEPVDGFHPNQEANYLIGQFFVQDLTANHPAFISKVNPFNSEIEQMFGDQGGYV